MSEFYKPCKLEIYNNQMYKIKESVKKNILCHETNLYTTINQRIQNGELPYFTSSSLERNFYGRNGLTLQMVVNGNLVSREQWLTIFQNPKNPLLIPFIQSMTHLHWSCLSRIEEALPLLALHLDKVNWSEFTVNPNPAVIPILEKNLDKVSKLYFCTNPNVLPILEKEPEKIDWCFFGWNQSIYEPDYESIRTRINIYKEELIAAAMHPRRIKKIMELIGEESEGGEEWDTFL